MAHSPETERAVAAAVQRSPRINGTWQGDCILLTAGLACLIALLLVLPLDPAVTHQHPRVLRRPDGTGDLDTPDYTRTIVNFDSEGTRIEAWLYLPKRREPPPPIVIMAHGLGGQRDFGLHPYAHEFATGGLAVLVFDYRNFGGSDGEPRNWVSPSRHVSDWIYAVHWVAHGNVDGKVDGSRIALWGTSFAGGHVLVAAARLHNGPRIKGIVSQVPHLSGQVSSKRSLQRRGILGSLRMGAAALHDQLRSMMGSLPPGYIKLAGRENELAFMLLSDAELESYLAKHPKEKLGGWQNMALARLGLEMPRYSPIDVLPLVQSPVLFVAATKDSLCPIELVRKAAETMGDRATLHEFDSSHFNLYLKDNFALSVRRQLGFFCKHLDLPQEPAVSPPRATDAVET